MRDIFRKPLFAISGALLVLVAIIAFGTVRTVQAASEESKSGDRLLVIHDGVNERGFLTRSASVREALADAGIQLDGNDLVEPSLDETLVASSYDINIYRARPVTVVDGAVRTKIMSAYRTPSQIAEHAGMELKKEDTTELSLPSTAPGNGASVQLTITRATPFTLVLYGKKTTAYTQAKTVEAMLEEKKIILGKDDTLSVSNETAITDGMTVELWRDGVQTVTEDVDIAFQTEKIEDGDREVGFREVVTPGTNGKRTVTYEIEMRNGAEVGRKEIQSVILTEPVKQVERVGVKPKYLPYSGGGNKDTWLAASNIPQSQWGFAEYLVQKESGWNPDAVNRSSGACGLGQQLPCGKWPGAWNDPIAALNGMHGYVMGRYGSWEAAVAHSKSRGWY